MIGIILVAVVVATVQGNLTSPEPLPAASNRTAAWPNSRIVGGTRCPSCPWMASIQVRMSKSWHHVCGGTIIQQMWILSAAHCFPRQHQPRNYRTRTGSPNWSSGGRLNSISDVILHERFADSEILEHDIALVKVTRRIYLNAGAAVALKLPRQGSGLPANTILTVSGWGVTHETSRDLPKYYRHVELRLTSRADCLKFFHGLTRSHICAYEDDKDSCSGDSGGPLYDEKTSRVVGIVSFGYGCGRPDWPGVYTDVANYVNWIRRKIQTSGSKNSTSAIDSLLVCWLVSLLNLLLYLLHFS